MNIYTANAIRAWDQYTILHEPISSIDLMERAAAACTSWLKAHLERKKILIICGKGNNGGDGLAIARLLIEKGIRPQVWIADFGFPASKDFSINLERLEKSPVPIVELAGMESLPEIDPETIILDSLFGSGLNRPLQGPAANLVDQLNQTGCEIISIDLPSGLFADQSSINNPVIQAHTTLSFQVPKLAFMMPENAPYVGQMILLDIGLHKDFELSEKTLFHYLEEERVKKILRPRSLYSHKGDFGHAGIFTGSYGMMGAAYLSSKACLRAGAGKVTAFIPRTGLSVLQTSLPELICKSDPDEKYLSYLPDLSAYSVLAIGPGIGTNTVTAALLKDICKNFRLPMVLDADALNLIGLHKDILSSIPEGSVLTPHPKEFERLFGPTNNDFDRLNLALQKSAEYGIHILLKGYHTLVTFSDGNAYFNSTGNPGMATAGSGDVLTGIIAGLIAQGYPPGEACLAAVYLHGLSGDLAVSRISEQALIASDLIEYLGPAFLSLKD